MLTYDHFSISEATELQLSMRKQIVLKPLESTVKTIGGADISYNKDSTKVFAGIVVLDYPSMNPRSYSLFEHDTTFPFVHNYLGFREVPHCFWPGNNCQTNRMYWFWTDRELRIRGMWVWQRILGF